MVIICVSAAEQRHYYKIHPGHAPSIQAQSLDTLTYSQAKKYLQEGHFPVGSMGSKIAAALNYLENGGRKVIITNAASMEDALEGRKGTHIVWV